MDQKCHPSFSCMHVRLSSDIHSRASKMGRIKQRHVVFLSNIFHCNHLSCEPLIDSLFEINLPDQHCDHSLYLSVFVHSLWMGFKFPMVL